MPGQDPSHSKFSLELHRRAQSQLVRATGKANRISVLSKFGKGVWRSLTVQSKWLPGPLPN